jgi:hypothetical protein
MSIAPFYVCKTMEIHHQKKHSTTSLIFISIFSKKLDKVYGDFKDWAENLLNKFDVGIVYVFNVGIIQIYFKILFIRNNLFSFKNFESFLLFTFSFEFTHFFTFFSQQEFPS